MKCKCQPKSQPSSIQSLLESKQQKASTLEESSTVHENPQLDEVKTVDMPVPLIEVVIPKEFCEVEY